VYAADDRVRIRPLDGIAGTVIRAAAAPRCWVVLADCAGQPVTWREDQLEPVLPDVTLH
jgi:hypothetical protein